MKSYKQHEAEILEILKEPDLEGCPESIPSSESLGFLAEELINPKPSITVNGWEKFNQATGGLRPKEFTILCGTSGTGKTTWLANLSSRLLTSSVNHFVASVETGAIDYATRVMSALDERDYNTGTVFSVEDVNKLIANYGHMFRANGFYLAPYDTKVNPMRMLCDIKHHREEHNCRIAILDNLNFFLPFSDSREGVVTMDRVIHDFIVFVKHTDVHVIMVMHPNKDAGKKDGAEGRITHLDEIKGSSSAPQEAHNVFFFNRVKKSDADIGFSPPQDFRDLTFAKLRKRGGYVGERIFYYNRGSSYEERSMMR